MLYRQYLLLAVLVCITGSVFAQKGKKAIRLNSGVVYTVPNISTDSLEQFNKRAFRKDKAFAILQFETSPSEELKKELAANGVILLDYIPDNAYTVSIQRKLNPDLLHKAKARTILIPSPQQKMHLSLVEAIRSSAVSSKSKSLINIQVRFPKSYEATEVIASLTSLKYNITNKDLISYRLISLQVPVSQLTELASLPFIEYVQEESSQVIPLNQTSRRMAGASILNASSTNGGRDLNGAGVVIGHGDDGNSQGHIDYTDRVISKTTLVGGHSTYVAGNMAGAGIRNELNRGYASKATMISTQYADVWLNAANYVKDYGMVLTNNSYQIVPQTCAASGIYDGYSAVIDHQAFLFPFLQQVFASGNHGNLTCVPYSASGFGTIAGSLQTAKNVITVGNIDKADVVNTYSSKGPVRDGRIKPEIVALGTSVTSTSTNSAGYTTNGGTSISAPSVTGGAALLYERYRQLNGNANPPSALIKALLCNGASDKGNPGPDYQYGFGSLNLLRSLEMLEKGWFINGSIGNGSSQTRTITVPANTAQLKVMIYWHDPAPSLLSASALVHDLDLEVVDPLSKTVLPLILDPTPTNVNNNSIEGVDRLNNIEQVVINNPEVGVYTLNIRGTTISQNPSQDYFIVYDVIPNSLALTFPVGGEGLVPEQSTRIQWESYGDLANSYHLEYSPDGGTTWTTIDNAISAGSTSYMWTVPAIATGNAKVRINKNGTTLNSSSNSFAIVGQPVIKLSSIQCPSYMAVQWSAIANATDYEIMRLSGGEMIPIGTTTGLTYTLNSLSPDSTYWVAVRARVNGVPGLRSVAISRQPTNGTCSGNISNNDLKLDAILSPVSGRKATASALATATEIKIRIRNLDNVVVNNFTVRYSIDGGATWVSETLATPIAALGTYEHTFASTVDMSALGTYQLSTTVVNTNPDPVTANNTLTTTIRHLDNPPVDLTADFIDDLETATTRNYLADTVGLVGLDRYDFINNTINGRLRTSVNGGFAASGSKAVTLDTDRSLAAPGNTNYLIGTFNLSAYTTANEIRLGFKYNQHGQLPHIANRVWIRGDDKATTPWIEVYNLDNNPGKAGIYKNVTSIEISDLLAANAQEVSSSFQVRWGQAGTNQAVNRENTSGYTLDDIKLYQVQNDMNLVSIDAPTMTGCGLSQTSQIVVTVRNTMNVEVRDLPIQYRINGSTWINEIIPTVPANTTLQYTFTKTADLSAFSNYKVEVNINKEGDSFLENNLAEVNVINLPLITTFPHLENFEASNGYWYTEGTNTSWAYGKPASALINKAASGTKAWKTNLTGHYNDNERSFLYSPCYDISSLANPMLSFSVAMDIEDCGTTLCDLAFVEYSSDGISWSKLGASGAGTNWYNKAGSQELWSKENNTHWHVATIPLPVGHNRMRLRFVFNSDPGLNKEGLAIDDIHIYEGNIGEIYSGATLAAPIQENISGGSSWINFTQSGALVASIQPNNQSLGVTDVQAYLAGSVQHNDDQYYLNRSFTIKPTNNILTDSVTVRLYFTDNQAEALINASGCTSCTKPMSAYELGISKYSHTNDSKENGNLCDNTETSHWSFIVPASVVKVPFLNGYYAEFKVKDFSEFWFNNGGADGLSSLSSIKIQDAKVLCINASDLTLLAKPEGGIWSGSGVSGDVFQPAVAGTGLHTLTYSYTDGNGCNATATTVITVHPQPTINTGEINPVRVDAPNVVLNALPAGGVWTGAGISGNQFQPGIAGVGNHILSYQLTDVNGCTASKNVSVIVNSLPAMLLDFQVQKATSREDVLVKWATQKEISVAKYEIEVCRGDADLQADRYVKIGEVLANGNTTETSNYDFMDKEMPKFGLRKYRLKIIDANGGAPLYSEVRTLDFSNPVLWQIHPNPSTGLFNLLYMSDIDIVLKARLFDAKGLLIKTYSEKGTGGMQRLIIDLSAQSTGVYLLQTEWKGEQRFFKLNKR